MTGKFFAKIVNFYKYNSKNYYFCHIVCDYHNSDEEHRKILSDNFDFGGIFTAIDARLYL